MGKNYINSSYVYRIQMYFKFALLWRDFTKKKKWKKHVFVNNGHDKKHTNDNSILVIDDFF